MKFYETVLGMRVVNDFGANVELNDGLFLQTADARKGFIDQKTDRIWANDAELFFEEQEFDAFVKKPEETEETAERKDVGIDYVKEHPK